MYLCTNNTHILPNLVPFYHTLMIGNVWGSSEKNMSAYIGLANCFAHLQCLMKRVDKKGRKMSMQKDHNISLKYQQLTFQKWRYASNLYITVLWIQHEKYEKPCNVLYRGKCVGEKGASIVTKGLKSLCFWNLSFTFSLKSTDMVSS